MVIREIGERQRLCCCDAVHLTEREIDVLRVLAAGKTSGQAAEVLGLSRRTIDSHVVSMLRKAGARNRTELLAAAVADGLIDMSATPPCWTGRSCLRSSESPAVSGGNCGLRPKSRSCGSEGAPDNS
jgi:DNA-binding CsgD family transcriptional regulator